MFTKTVFPPFEATNKILHTDSIYTCGSCFAEELSVRLKKNKFVVAHHPFGIVYNPQSILLQFQRILDQTPFSDNDLIFEDGLYHTFNHHSSLSSDDKNIFLSNINQGIQTAYHQISTCSYLVITFGSSYYYTTKKTNEIVSNCHKIPSKCFDLKRVELNDIVNNFKKIIYRIQDLNKKIKIILSVSPVRYLKYGFTENSLSKSILLLICDQLKSELKELEYFPAFEIFIDDLRDYRYVKEDLVHPNKLAIDYIWSYFENAYFNKTTQQINTEINLFQQLLNHRVLNSKTTSYENYLNTLQSKLHEIQTQYPEMDFSAEKKLILSLK